MNRPIFRGKLAVKLPGSKSEIHCDRWWQLKPFFFGVFTPIFGEVSQFESEVFVRQASSLDLARIFFIHGLVETTNQIAQARRVNYTAKLQLSTDAGRRKSGCFSVHPIEL